MLEFDGSPSYILLFQVIVHVIIAAVVFGIFRKIIQLVLSKDCFEMFKKLTIITCCVGFFAVGVRALCYSHYIQDLVFHRSSNRVNAYKFSNLIAITSDGCILFLGLFNVLVTITIFCVDMKYSDWKLAEDATPEHLITLSRYYHEYRLGMRELSDAELSTINRTLQFFARRQRFLSGANPFMMKIHHPEQFNYSRYLLNCTARTMESLLDVNFIVLIIISAVGFLIGFPLTLMTEVPNSTIYGRLYMIFLGISILVLSCILMCKLSDILLQLTPEVPKVAELILRMLAPRLMRATTTLSVEENEELALMTADSEDLLKIVKKLKRLSFSNSDEVAMNDNKEEKGNYHLYSKNIEDQIPNVELLVDENKEKSFARRMSKRFVNTINFKKEKKKESDFDMDEEDFAKNINPSLNSSVSSFGAEEQQVGSDPPIPAHFANKQSQFKTGSTMNSNNISQNIMVKSKAKPKKTFYSRNNSVPSANDGFDDSVSSSSSSRNVHHSNNSKNNNNKNDNDLLNTSLPYNALSPTGQINKDEGLNSAFFHSRADSDSEPDIDLEASIEIVRQRDSYSERRGITGDNNNSAALNMLTQANEEDTTFVLVGSKSSMTCSSFSVKHLSSETMAEEYNKKTVLKSAYKAGEKNKKDFVSVQIALPQLESKNKLNNRFNSSMKNQELTNPTDNNGTDMETTNKMKKNRDKIEISRRMSFASKVVARMQDKLNTLTKKSTSRTTSLGRPSFINQLLAENQQNDTSSRRADRLIASGGSTHLIVFWDDLTSLTTPNEVQDGPLLRRGKWFWSRQTINRQQALFSSYNSYGPYWYGAIIQIAFFLLCLCCMGVFMISHHRMYLGDPTIWGAEQVLSASDFTLPVSGPNSKSDILSTGFIALNCLLDVFLVFIATASCVSIIPNCILNLAISSNSELLARPDIILSEIVKSERVLQKQCLAVIDYWRSKAELMMSMSQKENRRLLYLTAFHHLPTASLNSIKSAFQDLAVERSVLEWRMATDVKYQARVMKDNEALKNAEKGTHSLVSGLFNSKQQTYGNQKNTFGNNDTYQKTNKTVNLDNGNLTSLEHGDIKRSVTFDNEDELLLNSHDQNESHLHSSSLPHLHGTENFHENDDYQPFEGISKVTIERTIANAGGNVKNNQASRQATEFVKSLDDPKELVITRRKAVKAINALNPYVQRDSILLANAMKFSMGGVFKPHMNFDEFAIFAVSVLQARTSEQVIAKSSVVEDVDILWRKMLFLDPESETLTALDLLESVNGMLGKPDIDQIFGMMANILEFQQSTLDVGNEMLSIFSSSKKTVTSNQGNKKIQLQVNSVGVTFENLVKWILQTQKNAVVLQGVQLESAEAAAVSI